MSIVLLSLSASDQDSGSNGQLIVRGNSGSAFAIDSVTAQLSVASSIDS